MPRFRRITQGNIIYHVLNRAQGKKTLFENNQDYRIFMNLISQAKEKIPMRILAYCLMPNHWHLILYPIKNNDLQQFLHWLSMTHAKRRHGFKGTTGSGHIYQDRYKSFPVTTDAYFYQVCRYVERNALRASLVNKAQDWQWSSAFFRCQNKKSHNEILDNWPAPPPANYIQWLNEAQDHKIIEKIRNSIQPRRGRPKIVR